MSPVTDGLAAFVAGVVVAEGCFTTGMAPSPRFRFAVGLGAVDLATCHLLHEYFGVGHLFTSPRRKAHYDDEVTFAVQGLRDLVTVIVPFMDEHLPPSHKRRQYLEGRLLGYWEHGAKRVRPCTVEGCVAPRRAKGLCRHHYYVTFGG